MVRDTNGRAYNRTEHLDGRRAMMQQWADYLDQLAAAAPTVALQPPVQPSAKATGRNAKR